jgi:predicted Rossmann fold nucleotide-binding protein DprA/Smf involved in DNA uptake
VAGTAAAHGEPWTAHRCARENVTDLETLAARAGWLLTEAVEALAAWEREGLALRLPGGRFQPLPEDGA